MKNIGIIVPCFNENETIIRFINELEGVLKDIDEHFIIIIVDDASYDNTPELLAKKTISAKNIELKIIQPKYNLGHQGAIYLGLKHAKQIGCFQVIVMDGDGEDDPNAIPLLLAQGSASIVNVKRGKRSENLVFKLMYYLYILAFYLVTGRKIDFGNYCLLDQRVLSAAVAKSFISLPAFLLKFKVEKKSIVIDRRKRLDGRSKMSLNSLIYHGFRSFSEFAEEFILLLLKMAITLAALFIISIGYVMYIKIFTEKAIIGWASTLSATFFNAALISFGFFFIGIVLLNIYHKTQRTENVDFTEIK